jgi:hypothetical protein
VKAASRVRRLQRDLALLRVPDAVFANSEVQSAQTHSFRAVDRMATEPERTPSVAIVATSARGMELARQQSAAIYDRNEWISS